MKIIKIIIYKTLVRLFPHYMADRFIEKMKQTNICIHARYDAYTHIMENCRYFLTENELNDKQFMKKTIHDIVYCLFKYGTNANEYFCYQFPVRNSQERNTYLPRKRKDDLLIKSFGKQWNNYLDILKDKYKFYQLAKDFFHRDACEVASNEDYKAFEVFMKKHGKAIAKPSRGGSGVGVTIIDLNDFCQDIEKAFNYVMSFNSPFIVEELVVQHPEMAKWNASSLNTIRVPSFLTPKGHSVIYPSIRIGRAGSIVDNAGSGGTFAAIDPKNGKIISKGFDKRGKCYDRHPDSGIIYLGEQIPAWDKLQEFVYNLHTTLLHEHRCVAFDLALSANGWVLIEGNWGEMSMPQIEFGKGLYKEFKDLLFA